MSDASRVLNHLEQCDLGDDPVSGVLTVVRRVQGRSWGTQVGRHTRIDGKWLAFDMPDGSILALDRKLEPVEDQTGEFWPWLMAVRDRAEYEMVMQSKVAPDWCVDAFRFALQNDQDTERKAA